MQSTRQQTAMPYDELTRALRETAVLSSAVSVLSWDQETLMPQSGSALRADQLALLSGLVHERRTHPRVGELLARCEEDSDLRADPAIAANLREIRREYDRATRLPADLVRETAQTTSLALEAWKDARERSDFASFAPWLEKVLRLSRRRAEHYGARSGAELYDALVEDYEPGMTVAELERLFGALRPRLVPLIAEITESGRKPDEAPHHVKIPQEQQEAFNRRVAEQIGFDFASGRLDVSTHPFCSGIGPGDTRMTTRYQDDHFTDSLSSTMHEAGHGLYEQGLRKAEHFGEPLAESTSFGVHESQSRLWENMVGRSREFWEWALPEARAAFGERAEPFTVDALYGAVNIVRPGLIRVDSDEATYNLHIMLRFDLERALLTGDLAIADLPAAWNERMRADLGVEVPDDRRGVLQDIHWAMGGISYFPSYTLGNLYAAQFWGTIRQEIPDLDDQMRRGAFGPLLDWLQQNIYVHGSRFTAAELCERVTGRPLSHEPLVDYLSGKLRPIYGLQ